MRLFTPDIRQNFGRVDEFLLVTSDRRHFFTGDFVRCMYLSAVNRCATQAGGCSIPRGVKSSRGAPLFH